MSTNPLERIPKRSPQTSVTDLNDFAKTAKSAAASAAYPIMLGLTGEVGRRTGNESLIDLYGSDIPPKYLEKITLSHFTLPHSSNRCFTWNSSTPVASGRGRGREKGR